jgi:hypothetical protein
MAIRASAAPVADLPTRSHDCRPLPGSGAPPPAAVASGRPTRSHAGSPGSRTRTKSKSAIQCSEFDFRPISNRHGPDVPCRQHRDTSLYPRYSKHGIWLAYARYMNFGFICQVYLAYVWKPFVNARDTIG